MFSLPKATDITKTGCSLTIPLAGVGPPSFPTCTNLAGPIYVGMPVGANPLCSGTQLAPCLTSLPTGYTTAYTFYSVAFNVPATTDYYVLTYLPPPPASSDNFNLGLLCLPGYTTGAPATCGSPHTQFPLTFGTMYKQLTKSLFVSPLYYGTITTSGKLTTPTQSAGGAPMFLQYDVPLVPNVPVGSIGFIAKIMPCLSC